MAGRPPLHEELAAIVDATLYRLGRPLEATHRDELEDRFRAYVLEQLGLEAAAAVARPRTAEEATALLEAEALARLELLDEQAPRPVTFCARCHGTTSADPDALPGRSPVRVRAKVPGADGLLEDRDLVVCRDCAERLGLTLHVGDFSIAGGSGLRLAGPVDPGATELRASIPSEVAPGAPLVEARPHPGTVEVAADPPGPVGGGR